MIQPSEPDMTHISFGEFNKDLIFKWTKKYFDLRKASLKKVLFSKILSYVTLFLTTIMDTCYTLYQLRSPGVSSREGQNYELIA